MVIGLVFFIRASTKDRIEVAQFRSVQQADELRQAVTRYFYSRAYQPPSSTPDKLPKAAATITDGTTLVGMVSPSLFLAVFLSGLAAVGFACLSLIVATLFPAWGGWLLGLVAASPLAGVFYWKKSSRPERVVLRVDSLKMDSLLSESDSESDNTQWMSTLTVQGHRDELEDLEQAFAQPKLKEWAKLEKTMQG
jgi:Cofactor assembly of complex C subunit B